MAGAAPEFINIQAENGYRLDLSQLPESTWAATQVLYLCSPGNPTGSVMTLQDWGSLFINALAVSETHRGKGLGGDLLDWTERHARLQNFERLSLHVWADNVGARKLYERRGFLPIAVAEIVWHERLRHTGGSILMSKRLADG